MKAIQRSYRLIAGHGSLVSRRVNRDARHEYSWARGHSSSGPRQRYNRITLLASSSMAVTGIAFLSQENKQESERPSSATVASRYANKKVMLEVGNNGSKFRQS